VNERNALLAGVPRSGSTLTCELLNLVPDTVALDEPMDVPTLTGRARRNADPERGSPPDPGPIGDDIDHFLDRMRESLALHGTAVSKQVRGRVTGGKYAEEADGDGPRASLATLGEIHVEKDLSPDFLLLIKHTGAFTALAEPLARRFRLFATIRNPLAILASWQTVDFPGREGHHPVAEEIDSGLASTLAAIDDRVERQITLIGWFFEQYAAHLPAEQIIRYEAIVESGGRALSVITEPASRLDEPLASRNRAAVYDAATMRALAERLLGTDGAYWAFYPPDSVKALAAV
jgi:hypothetical protein